MKFSLATLMLFLTGMSVFGGGLVCMDRFINQRHPSGWLAWGFVSLLFGGIVLIFFALAELIDPISAPEKKPDED